MAMKLYSDAEIKSIADAIRTKNGQTTTYKVGEMADALCSAPQRPTEEIPAYVRAEAKRLAAVVKARQTTNSVSFICVSDIHDAQTTVGENVPIRDCALGAYLVRQLVPIDFAIMLGDYINAAPNVDNENNVRAQFKNAMKYVSYFADAMTQGNHDNGMAGLTDDFVFSTDELYQRIGSNAINVVRPTTEAERGYYYFDVPDKKFRAIILNTNDVKGIAFKAHTTSETYNDGHRVSVEQCNWFKGILTAIPSDYRFAIFSHEPIHWTNYTYTDANNITWDMAQNWNKILDAYVGGTSFTFTQDGQTVSGDFSAISRGTCCGAFHGHTHNFIDGKYGDNNILRVSTPNACNGRTNEYGGTSYPDAFRQKFGELKSDGTQETAYFKTAAGTTKDTAFTVNTIDFENAVVYSDCYGAGKDRILSYGATTVYSVTASVGEHITAGTIPSEVEEGTALTVTLTPAENYSAKITVTMGGTDITTTSVSGNTVSIASVTGNVVINAVAVYTGNLVSLVGYTDNKRYSTSTGELKDAAGYAAINNIPFNRPENGTVKFKFSGLNWSKDVNCTFVGTKDGEFFNIADYLNAAINQTSTGIKWEIFDDYCLLTLSEPTQEARKGWNGFKCSGFGLGTNAIITQI